MTNTERPATNSANIRSSVDMILNCCMEFLLLDIDTEMVD